MEGEKVNADPYIVITCCIVIYILLSITEYLSDESLHAARQWLWEILPPQP